MLRYLNMCSKFQFVLIHLIMARIRKYNQTFKSNPITVYVYIQCIIQSHDRKHDYLLTLLILDIQVLKKKESGAHRLSRVKCTVQVQIKSNLNFPAAMSLTRSSFNREIKLTWCFKSVDRQNRSMMPLSC